MRPGPAPWILLSLVLVLFQAELLGAAEAASPAVGVRNVPPQFRRVALGAREGYHFIDVTVSDFNTWHDVLRVDVLVLDDYGGVLGKVRFRQYNQTGQGSNVTYANSTTFEDLSGDLLKREVSYYWASNLTATYVERSEINLTFALRPVRGSSLDLTAVDRQGASANVTVDYSVSAIGFPGTEPFLPPPLDSLDASTLIALLYAAFTTSLLMMQRYGTLTRLLGRLGGRRG